MTSDKSQATFCSTLSSQAGEPLAGSATSVKRYLLLEYNGPWGEKALEESALSETVKKHIDEFVKSDRDNKALLIRTRRPNPGKQALFLASVSDGSQALFAFELEDYEQLLDMDFTALLQDPSQSHAGQSVDLLILVCTNGRRDLCCARYGQPVLNTLQEANAASPYPLVWQSTHMGGHRFAANLIVLPFGLLYGRVDPGNALQILEASRQGQIFLPNLRGRTAYPAPVQAADLYLRQQTGDYALGAYQLADSQQTGPQSWLVAFRETRSGDRHYLTVRVDETQERVYESCRLDKTTPLVRYHVNRQQAHTPRRPSLTDEKKGLSL